MAKSHCRLQRRRGLTFQTLQEVATEARSLLRSGYEQAGKWSLGQNCNHLAQTLNMSVDGFPIALPFPVSAVNRWLFFHTRWFGQVAGRVRVPTFPRLAQSDPVDDSVGVERLTQAIERVLSCRDGFAANPVMGRLSREQWLQFHVFHAERHLSFLVPQSATAVEPSVGGQVLPAET